ncbi:DUF1127 domain-containing protein [Bosea caraganae]|uniref:DUF1127 domain-containing protein n=1 Tax=Bosea caraganae TaxID=2763117 RepID=A0A370LCX5_9HYPH|nr:DUF1127 domain-containing protein [Bosea caraganae]RDJ27359.1 DUF1127 domain-containing protein [Bosea caraganae]RDJ29375.1 DUF1127 domain-containing protein [Bosea caraganae]
MTCSDHATSLAPAPVRLSAAPAHALGELLSRLLAGVGAFVMARRNRRAIAELAECEDRMLRDIGLNRSIVDGVLEVGFGRDPSAVLERPSPSYAACEVERAKQISWMRIHG